MVFELIDKSIRHAQLALSLPVCDFSDVLITEVLPDPT